MIRPALRLGLAAFAAGGAVGCSLADLSGLSIGTSATSATSTGVGGGTSTTGPGGEGGAATGGGGVSSFTTVTATTGVGGSGGDGGAGGQGGGDATTGGTGGAGGAEPCVPGGICEVVETFDDGPIDTVVWGPFGVCERGLDGGRWAVDAVVDGTGYCGHYTRGFYDMRDQLVTVAIPESTVGAIGAMTYFVIEEGEDLPRVGIRQHGGRLETEANDVVEDVGPYDPDDHRFWAVAEEAGEILFLVRAATAGADWVEIGRTSAPFDPAAVRVVFGIGTYQALAAPGRGVFDCINVDPDDCPP